MGGAIVATAMMNCARTLSFNPSNFRDTMFGAFGKLSQFGAFVTNHGSRLLRIPQLSLGRPTEGSKHNAFNSANRNLDDPATGPNRHEKERGEEQPVRKVGIVETPIVHKLDDTPKVELARLSLLDEEKSTDQLRREFEEDTKLEQEEVKKLDENARRELLDRKRRTMLNTRLAKLGFCVLIQNSEPSSARAASSICMVSRFERRLALELNSNKVRTFDEQPFDEQPFDEQPFDEKLDKLRKQFDERLDKLCKQFDERLDKLCKQIEVMRDQRKPNRAFAEQAEKLKKRWTEDNRELKGLPERIVRDVSSITSLKLEIDKDRAFFLGSHKHFLTKPSRTELDRGFKVMEKVLAKATLETENDLKLVDPLLIQLNDLKRQFEPA